jgi:hypothetical protein
VATLELKRALARPDAETLVRQVDAYAEYFARGGGDWPDEYADDFSEVLNCAHDPEKAIAYVVLGASRTDNAEFLRFLGCGPLEDALYSASPALMDRIIAEARRSRRFRWLLSTPYRIAMGEAAWEKIQIFRSTGPHEEPPLDTLPPRHAS